MRTYSGHSSAAASNALYRQNLAKGQTGLSVAFDLPTQLGYDPDHSLSRGEVGRVGVPVAHLGHMGELLDGIPLDAMNTSMTINATAPWLLALYVTHAARTGVEASQLRGTTQNDLLKEYLSRGTYIFPPMPSRRLTVDVIAYCATHVPSWNPINICSYHLREAGGTPVQEIAYAMANAIDVLDAVAASGQVSDAQFPSVVGSISFFLNSGIRFVEEVCKVRAMTQMWSDICARRYGIDDPKLRRFRYGVQVNSLGLTEAQPENNVQRIVLEMLGVTLSKQARTRSLQLPAWNEALGLPRPEDQQWSLRMQQVLAHETDLLEHDDIFDGSHVVEERTAEMVRAARAEMNEIVDAGGAFAMVDELKARLVAANTDRVRSIETGDETVVGVNSFTETNASPMGVGEQFMRADPAAAEQLVADVDRWRAARDQSAVLAAIDDLKIAASSDVNIVGPSLAAAAAGVTTGEWAMALREVFGEHVASTGVGAQAQRRSGSAFGATAARCAELAGGPPRVLVGKPGLDGHSNGAEQVAVAARDSGMEVIYDGIRSTPEQIAAAARDEDVDLVWLSILSGSHLAVVPEVVNLLRGEGVRAPVVAEGIIPDGDAAVLRAAGVADTFAPKDFELAVMMDRIVELAKAHRTASA